MSRFCLIVVMLALLLGSGCALFRNPFASWTKASNKVASVEQKIDKNQDAIVDEGKKYVYATKLALDKNPETNKFTDLAGNLNDKSIAILGSPTVEDINYLKVMVDNLLSENKKNIIKGEKQLAELDSQVIDLQKENSTLKDKLDSAEKKLETVGLANAGLAQKWSNLVKIFWYIVYFFIAVFVIRILAAVVPPPYNSFIGIIAVPFGLITKAIHGFIPEAKNVAGVVSNHYQTATEDLIQAIQKIKEAHPELHTEISKTIYNETDSNTSAPIINATKTSLGIVS